MQITEIHKRMVRYVFLNIELLLNDRIHEINEYDVQSFMFLSFRRQLNNTDFSAEREKNGKVDCVLYEKTMPRIFYEIKTYFKINEELNRLDFDHDIDKIKNRLEEYKNACGYIFIAGMGKKFKGDVLNKFDFISKKLTDESKKWVTYELEGNISIKLRPSIKETKGQSYILTWEVKLIKK